MVKVNIICSFYTDEDYTISENFLKEYNKNHIDIESTECESINREIYKKYYDTIEEEPYGDILYPDYMFKIETTDIIEAERFIEKLSVSFRVSYTHRWLQKSLYDMTDHALEYMNSFKRLLRADFFEDISGNYTGTYIYIFTSFVSNE